MPLWFKQGHLNPRAILDGPAAWFGKAWVTSCDLSYTKGTCP